jgi:hypothetical protein
MAKNDAVDFDETGDECPYCNGTGTVAGCFEDICSGADCDPEEGQGNGFGHAAALARGERGASMSAAEAVRAERAGEGPARMPGDRSAAEVARMTGAFGPLGLSLWITLLAFAPAVLRADLAKPRPVKVVPTIMVVNAVPKKLYYDRVPQPDLRFAHWAGRLYRLPVTP